MARFILDISELSNEQIAEYQEQIISQFSKNHQVSISCINSTDSTQFYGNKILNALTTEEVNFFNHNLIKEQFRIGVLDNIRNNQDNLEYLKNHILIRFKDAYEKNYPEIDFNGIYDENTIFNDEIFSNFFIAVSIDVSKPWDSQPQEIIRAYNWKDAYKIAQMESNKRGRAIRLSSTEGFDNNGTYIHPEQKILESSE